MPRRDKPRTGGRLVQAFTSSLGLLRGLQRPSKPLQNQALPASSEKLKKLTDDLQKDLTHGTTAEVHESGASRLFASDAVRSSIFLVPQGGNWRNQPDIHPASQESLAATMQSITKFCDGDHAWAFRVSQFANQNLGNSAWLAGIIGGQVLDGRRYNSRTIKTCQTLQGDQSSPEHNRLVLTRTSDQTMQLQWTRMRDVTSLHLEGRSKPKNLTGRGASYEVSLTVDIDRPKADEVAPVRVSEAVLHTRLPRLLDS